MKKVLFIICMTILLAVFVGCSSNQQAMAVEDFNNSRLSADYVAKIPEKYGARGYLRNTELVTEELRDTTDELYGKEFLIKGKFYARFVMEGSLSHPWKQWIVLTPSKGNNDRSWMLYTYKHPPYRYSEVMLTTNIFWLTKEVEDEWFKKVLEAKTKTEGAMVTFKAKYLGAHTRRIGEGACWLIHKFEIVKVIKIEKS